MVLLVCLYAYSGLSPAGILVASSGRNSAKFRFPSEIPTVASGMPIPAEKYLNRNGLSYHQFFRFFSGNPKKNSGYHNCFPATHDMYHPTTKQYE
jgi:hypothetical protein